MRAVSGKPAPWCLLGRRAPVRAPDLKPASARRPHARAVDPGSEEDGMTGRFRIITYRMGTEGNDVLGGWPSHDTIDGLGGDDWLTGGPGGDTLRGGDGNDQLVGGNGYDTLDGGGDDWLIGGPGGDTMIGGPGRDTVSY